MGNSMNVTVIGELWAAFLCFMAFLVMALYRNKTRKDKCVREILLVCMILLVSDAATWHFDGVPGSAARIILYISNYLLYVSCYLIIALFFWYMWHIVQRENEQIPLLFKVFWAIVAVCVVVLTIGIFFNLYFYFDEWNVYHRTNAYIFSQLILVLGVITLLWSTVKYRDRLSKFEVIAACSYFMLPPLGTLIQIFHYGIAFQQLAFAVATLITFFVREAEVRRELQETTSREQKSRMELAEKLRINEALSQEYTGVFMINCDDGSMKVLKLDGNQNAASMKINGISYDEFRKGYLFRFALPEYSADVIRLSELPNLIQYFEKGNKNLLVRYKTKPNQAGQTNFELHVVPFLDGDSNQIIFGCRCIDARVSKEEESREIIGSLGKAYFCMYYIDLASGEYRQLENPSIGVVSETINQSGNATVAFKDMSSNLVTAEHAAEMLQFTDITTLSQRLQNQDTLGIHFFGPHVGWCEGLFACAKRDEAGQCTHVIWGVRSIQQEMEKEEEYKRKLKEAKEAAEKHSEELNEQLDIIGSLASTYASIYYVDMSNLTFVELGKSSDYVENIIKSEGDAVHAMELMCTYIVVSDQANAMREFVDFGTLNERLHDCLWIGKQFQAGSGRWNEGVFIAAKRDEDGNCLNVIWAVRDINEMKLREIVYQKELEEARDRADAASAAKSSFLFNMSHDIRTPMNAIIGYTDLIEKHFDDKEKCLDYLHKTQQSNRFLLSLINDVLEMARIESGKAQLEEDVSPVGGIAREISDIFEDQMKQKGITYVSNVQTHTEWAFYDQAKVREIYLNILSNALKYTPSGGKVCLQVDEIPWDRPGYIGMKAVFSDTGIGMTKEFLPHLFEAFTRERTATDSRQQGTGLGMPIVKKILDLMGGTIEVESEPGKGSTFTVTYPLKVEGALPVEKKEVHTAEIVDFSGKRILLTEDNDLNAEIAMEILSEVGFLVDRAEDGVICVDMLQKAESGYYDLILMDIQMPNLNGYEATKKIRALSEKALAQIPIVAMTANAFESDRQDAFAAGMDGHIAKPIEVPKLLETLAQILA